MIDNVKEMIDFIQNQKRTEKKVSLERMKTICSFYENPQDGLKYIHVGGTNGKGSIVSYLKNILLEEGYHVGSFISPYVICFNERIQFDNQYITDEKILEIGNIILSKYYLFDEANMPYPTFFEFVTLMAFIYFNSIKNIDYVILEVGIGGLLDCTNVIEPMISVIANVSYDHMNILGETLEEIAINKLGIVKEGKPLVTIYNEQLDNLFKSYCHNKKSELIIVNKKDIKELTISDEGMSFIYKDMLIKSNMIGYYQAENIAIAIETINVLNSLNNCSVTKESIKKGIEKTFWPGRFQIVNHKPLIIVDGAHNIDGIARLCETVNGLAKGRKIIVIFAVSKDKEKENMIHQLDKIATELIFSSFNYKRSDDPELLMCMSKNSHCSVLNDLDDYIKEIQKCESDNVYVFCGSLYFVSEILPKFQG